MLVIADAGMAPAPYAAIVTVEAFSIIVFVPFSHVVIDILPGEAAQPRLRTFVIVTFHVLAALSASVTLIQKVFVC